MWTLWNKIYFIKSSFWNFYEVRTERGGGSIDADSGAHGYVLWCCGSTSREECNFIQIGSSHTVTMISFQWLLMPILLETLVIRHFLTLVAQLQQAGVGISRLLNILVETMILVGMNFLTVEILLNDLQMLILCLYYLTVLL